jgi:hypothetical protein
MRAPFEKDRSLKKLQSQIAELERHHPNYPEQVISLVNAHNHRMSMERDLVEAVCHGPVEDNVYAALNENFDKSAQLDNYLRDAISRFVNNEF